MQKMEINDAYMKEMISSYQKTREGFPEILEHLSMFIYFFPKLITNNCNEDVFGEYYEYFLERMGKTLLSYTPLPSVLFKTWFYLVQRRHYLNFLKSRKNTSLSTMAYEFMESYTLDTLGFSLPPALQNETDQRFTHLISEGDLLFLKLFSPENLTKEDLSKLMDLLNCDFKTLTQRMRILFDQVGLDNDRKIVRLVPINRVALFLGWNRLKVSKKLTKIKEKVNKNEVWVD